MPRQLCEAGIDAAEPVDKTTQYSRQLSERSTVPLHVRRTIRYRRQSSYIRAFYDSDGTWISHRLSKGVVWSLLAAVLSSTSLSRLLLDYCTLVGLPKATYIKSTSKCQPSRDKGTPAKPQARHCILCRFPEVAMAQSLAGAIALLAAGGLRLSLPKSLAISPNSTDAPEQCRQS
jgi:hypothetical protein